MPTFYPTTRTLDTTQMDEIPLENYDSDGTTLDATETLQMSASNPSVASVSLKPGNPRVAQVKGVAPGSTQISITAPGVEPFGDGPMVFNYTVVAPPPNLSKVRVAPSGIVGPLPKT